MSHSAFSLNPRNPIVTAPARGYIIVAPAALLLRHQAPRTCNAAAASNGSGFEKKCDIPSLILILPSFSSWNNHLFNFYYLS